MKEILISKDLTPFEKEVALDRFFQTFQPQTSPFLLGEFALSHQDYQKLSEYFLKQELAESFYRYPAIFAFLITEFAYWTDDWENNSSFWESFEKQFHIPFSVTIYQTLKKGYRKLGVIAQPQKGFKYVNWCTMQSILGRNAVKRLAELIQYFKHSNIEKNQIKDAFEKSYIVDLKLAVLSHLYLIAPELVLSFLGKLLRGEYESCIYFRNDKQFINQFEELLKLKFFYSRLFSTQQLDEKEPKYSLEDNRIKCHIFEDSAITPENVDIKQYKGKKIIGKYGNNWHATKWQKSSLLWGESFNVFLQAKKQTIEFYLEDREQKIFELPLPSLGKKDFWIFNMNSNLLNEALEEIPIPIEDDIRLQFVTTQINDLEDLKIENYEKYFDDDQYFIFTFKPNTNLTQQSLGKNVLLYEFPNSIRFNFNPLFTNKGDNIPVLNELPEIYFDQKISIGGIILEINGEEVPCEKFCNKAIVEETYWLLSIEKLHTWKPFGKNRIDILHDRVFESFEFYFLRDLDTMKFYHFRDHFELKIEFVKKGYEIVAPEHNVLTSKHSFTIKSSETPKEFEFTIRRIKSNEILPFAIDTVTTSSHIVFNKQKLIDSDEICLLDLFNCDIAVELCGQARQKFALSLVDAFNKRLYHFGNDFRFSKTCRFLLGKIFFQKYYSEISKRIKKTCGSLKFKYEYSVPFSKPYCFNICKINNNEPEIRHYDLSTSSDKINLAFEIEKLPLKTLALFLFSSDFSEVSKIIVEDENRLPSQELRIKRDFSIPQPIEHALIYACLAVNDRLITDLKQLTINRSQTENPLAAFIDYAYKNFVLNKEFDREALTLSTEKKEYINTIFTNDELLCNFLAFLQMPEISEIFRESLVKIILANKTFFWRKLLETKIDSQLQIVKFLVESGGLDFFHLQAAERDSLRQELYNYQWKNKELIEKLIKVQLHDYAGLYNEEAIDWLRIKIGGKIQVQGKRPGKFVVKTFSIIDGNAICSGEYSYKFGHSKRKASKEYSNLKIQDYNNFIEDSGQIKFYIDRDFCPPFGVSNPIVKLIKDELKELKDHKSLVKIKSGKLESTSDKLRGWFISLRRNSKIIEDLLCVFYNYELLPTTSSKKKQMEQQIIEVFQISHRLFCYLIILRELVQQWENQKWEKPDESYFKSVDRSAKTETIADEIFVDPLSGQLGLFKE